MLTLRPAHQRGHINHGWLDTWHSFSFAEYYDPDHMGVSHLRVINDDRIAPGAGFPTHPHSDMEIVTYMLQGTLGHKDSMGNGTRIEAGEVQRMSAGSGITHSEYNASADEPVHLLQIWLLPRSRGITPSYEQRRFSDREKQGRLCPIATPDGAEGALALHQDAKIFATLLDSDTTLTHSLPASRIGYLHVARGTLRLNGRTLSAGDGATLRGEPIELTGVGSAEALLFDLAAPLEG